MTSKSGGLPFRSLPLSIIVAILALAAVVLAVTLIVLLFLRLRANDAGIHLAAAAFPSVAAAAGDQTRLNAAPTPTWLEGNTRVASNPLPTKPVITGLSEARPTWTATPPPTNTPIPSPTPNPTFVSSAYGLGEFMPRDIRPAQRWIDVNLSEQKLVAFEGFVPVFESLVSTGTANHPTVTGQFRIWLRFRAQDMNGYRLGYDYYLRGVPYVQYFYQDYALHGTYWHSNFGTPMSHGCVNLPTEAAEWLYNWADFGTLVNIHH